MQKIGFEEAVAKIRSQDDRFDPDAYAFLKDALDYSVRSGKQQVMDECSHVSGADLLNGFRDLALEEFGPMARTVLEIWGVNCTEDVGEMVFQLIDMGAFGKSDNDSRDDFVEVYSFEDVFSKPFQPKKENRNLSKEETDEADSEIRIQDQKDRKKKRSKAEADPADAGGDSHRHTAEGNS